MQLSQEQHARLRIRSLIRTLYGQMAALESSRALMMSEIDTDLERRVFDAIDSANVAQLNSLIKEFDDLGSDSSSISYLD